MTSKILITEVVHLVEKKLGINGVEACDFIDKHLDSKRKSETRSKYMSKDDLVYFRSTFLSMVDLSKLNPLDYSCFLDKTNYLLENGSSINTAKSENNRLDPYIKTVKIFL